MAKKPSLSQQQMMANKTMQNAMAPVKSTRSKKTQSSEATKVTTTEPIMSSFDL